MSRLNPRVRFRRDDGGSYSDWKLTCVDKIAKIVGGGTPSSDKPEYWGGDIVWFTPTEIKQKYLHSSLRTLSDAGLRRSAAEIVPPGALLFTSRATVGDIGIATIACCTNQGFKSFLVNSKCINEFLYYWIVQNKRNFLRKASGSTYLEVSKNEIRKMPIYLPDIEEQRKIARFLSAVDDKLNALRRKQTLMERYKKGLLQKLFSQEIRFKDDQGGDPKWEERKIGEICEIDPPNDNEIPERFIYIDLKSVKSGMLVERNLVCKSSAPSSAQRLIRKHDVLIQKVRPYQQNNLYFEFDGDYVASAGYAQLRSSESAKFLYFSMHVKNTVDKMLALCTGTTYPTIRSSDLATISIYLPPKQEQQKIADFLSAIDLKITAVGDQIKQFEKFKKGLLQQLFV